MNTYYEDLQTLLLNVFFIFTFLLIYLKNSERTHRMTNEGLIILTGGISMVCCMTFTIPLNPYYFYDLRTIPFIVGSLYGGRRVSVILFFIIAVYHFFLMGPRIYPSVIPDFFLLILLLFIIPLFQKHSSLKKRLWIVLIASAFCILFKISIVEIFIRELVDLRYFIFNLIFAIIHSIGLLKIVKFFEKTKKNIALTNEMEKLEKLKDVSEMAASISHEVRNPLTVTKGFLQLMKDSKLTHEKRKLYINFSLEELERAEQIITDYLTFAKPSLQIVENLNLSRELDYVIKVVNPFAMMNNVVISIEKSEEIFISGEAQKLHQCLINIIKNGIEAMPNGGSIFILLKNRNGKAVIIIKDTGTGMKKEQLEKLGTPYFSTKSSGTGLGTMVIFSIVKEMRGEVKVESELGKGTTFTLFIPIAKK